MTEATKKPIDRRQQIVEAAGQSFAMFGYKATTMELVSKIAAVGKGTIYTFFATKEELFNEIIESLTAELRSLALRTIDREKPFFYNLTSVLRELLQFREKHELIVKLSQEVRDIGTPMAKAGIDHLEQVIVSFIRDEVASAVDKGELRPVDPALTALVMLKMYVALSVDWSKRHEALSQEAIAEYAAALLQNGLAAK
ncbi:TetR/AcrR family transcriptional regulator [Paenibacillus mendelii]|uniref:TetR/AcrR family transcriptional regulator n=1 Tax=Paenibacillus mendelii TaxID=206163 RepID=A0ABV6JJ88_9BACL|nr:TetR/AcrR family transcriptional regulator [Paenibacillus mendelii]MCQ6558909.1 TetR/AcrR family transcriptional regulator [Paenibacillus mendelii]